MPDAKDNDIVRLARARHPMEAHIWRQALETEGIRCEVVGDYLFAGEVGTSHDASELWVRRKDYEFAKSILQVYQQFANLEDEEEE
jgi:hypothetical protein